MKKMSHPFDSLIDSYWTHNLTKSLTNILWLQGPEVVTSQPGGSSSNSSNKPETVIAMKPEVAANDSGSSPKVNFSISKFDILFKFF